MPKVVFDFQWLAPKAEQQTAAIIVGPIPHSTAGKGDYSSAIVAME